MNESMPRSEDAGSGTRSQVREKASVLARGVKEQARARYDERKNVAVGELGTLASQLRSVVDELSSSHPDNMTGRLVSTLADRIESFGQSLEGKDLDTLISDVEQFARRNPAAFLGGAVAVGFLASRFLKSSASRAMTSWDSSEALTSDNLDRTDFPIGSTGYSGGAVPTSGLSGSGTSSMNSTNMRSGSGLDSSRSSSMNSGIGSLDTDDLSGGRK